MTAINIEKVKVSLHEQLGRAHIAGDYYTAAITHSAIDAIDRLISDTETLEDKLGEARRDIARLKSGNRIGVKA